MIPPIIFGIVAAALSTLAALNVSKSLKTGSARFFGFRVTRTDNAARFWLDVAVNATAGILCALGAVSILLRLI